MQSHLPEGARIRTTAIHAGEQPDPTTLASAPNIVMSTTFSVDEPRGFSALDQEGDDGFFYTRWGNPTIRQLEEKLAALEGVEDCRAYASGMAAISSLLFNRLSAGDRLVISDVAYPGTTELAHNTLPRMGVEVTAVDMSDLDRVEAALQEPAKLVWVETPANPILRLTDIAAVAELAHAAGAEVAVDSTFATPIATRPLELGADYVVHSLTKYIGGHGDALGGAVLSDRERLEELQLEATVHFGGVISPFNAWLIMRGAATLPLRMAAHEAGATVVARALEEHPRVRRVVYPGLESHPQHELARRQMANFSGMIAFQVDDGPAVAERMMKELRVVHYAVSLGHHRSLIYWLGTDDLVASSFHLEGPALDSYRDYAGDGVFRLSVGLEDPQDILEDLDRVL
ncbi:MAG: PLP-dependent aspartate aminotransferase family protein [Actinomycetes bacterium]|jgi:cystathionine beta-lyase/cystathionine gamma-synthase|nr:PLP-dependent transferase [Acidimicrobiia bacterium]